MSTLEKVVNWLDTYREVTFDLLRIYLGVGLFVRGVLFFYDPTSYTELVPATASSLFTSTTFLYLVAAVHVVGGAMMAVGFWTRLAALTQMPILLGAVSLSLGGLFSADQSFEFSALVLFLLVLVFFLGSGNWSVDHFWSRKRSALQQHLDALFAYREEAFALLRVYLGVGLFVRGVLFISDSATFVEMLSPDAGSLLTSTVLVHYVALSHVFGGAMMAAGLLTRVAALVQVPILVGAVFVAQLQGGLLLADQSFEFSALVLFLLVLIFLYGSGRWSAQYYLFTRTTEEPEPSVRTSRAAEILSREVPEEELFADPIGVLAKPQAMTRTAEELRQDPLVTAQPQYSFWGWFLFLVDVTPRPKEIVFRNIKTGQIVERSRDPEVLEKFRYH